VKAPANAKIAHGPAQDAASSAGSASQREERRAAVWQYLFLASQANGSSVTPPVGRTALQEATGMTAKGVQVALQDLLDNGMISIESESRGARGARYRVLRRPVVSEPEIPNETRSIEYDMEWQ
jgi:hypothetical protein